MAWSDYHPHPQALPQFKHKVEGTHERAVGRSVVDKDISTSNNQCRTRHRKPTTTDRQKALCIFAVVYKLLDTIHIDQSGVFPIILQQGYQYIIVGIHLDAN